MTVRRLCFLAAALVLVTGCPLVINFPCNPDCPGEETQEEEREDGYVIVIDFQDYRGTEETLPQGLFVTADHRSGDSMFGGVHTIADNDSFEGFGAFSNGSNYSFGIRERGDTVHLRDTRLFLEYTNPTEHVITGFKVSYDVEVWLWGERANRIRMKYHTDIDSIGDTDDIVSTVNPKGIGASGGFIGELYDGMLPANRREVEVAFCLSDFSLTPLGPGETGFFRWQYSNADGDAGALRSGLGINNIVIEPIFGEVLQFQVIYDPNGETAGTPPQGGFFDSETSITVSGNSGDLVRESYSFKEWNTCPEGTGISYLPGDAFIITEDVTLYAIYEQVFDVVID